MDKPILYKDIEVDGRKFRLNKLDARTGSYMSVKLMGILTPLFENVDLSNLKDIKLNDLNIAKMTKTLFKMPEEDFRFVQDNCLQLVKELLPAGPQKVLDEYGKWGVLDIEFDTGLVMNLTIQSLVFNVTGFFKESLLSSLINRATTILQNSKI
ncbi:hypothetical protein CLPUN_42380 [Clostridium puniceum]|uniref:Uncharacterized protein n=1 Tax=Clostridium puniceum TaxID=29367 RepID=A0A1S8T885_9CLOT|nr:hypothetical protein [Clostridium puniceum]OOM74000.1 hypothetical protein CLPUN_42380 [Clostridium puniceum]